MKYLLLLMMFAVGGFLAFGYTQRDEEFVNTYVPDFTWDDIQAIYQRRIALDARHRSTHRFHDCLEGIKRDLWQGKITLAAAADALCEAGIRDDHAFRCMLHSCEADLPQRERMALILLRHLRQEIGARTVPPGRESVPEQLRCELASWPGVNPATLDALATEEAWFAESLKYNASAP